MELFILRHGIAVERENWNFQNDSARPLTAKGKKALRKNCAALKSLQLDFDLILSSPFARAKKTAEIVAKKMKLEKRLKFSGSLKPDGAPVKLIRELNAFKPSPKKVLLVGHEPYLSGLVARLVGGGPVKMALGKGGICKLEIAKLRNGQCATLAWMLTPAQLKLMR